MSDLVDTHCHLDFEKFDDDRDAVIERALEAGVRRIVVPGLDIETSKAAIALSERHDGIFAAVGFHPNSLESGLDMSSSIAELRDLAQHPKVVAIGEIGLDYYWDKSAPSLQHAWLQAQLDLGSEVGLPVILHNRESTDDILAMLKRWTEQGLPEEMKDRPGVMHSFSATWADAQTAFDLNFWIGFTGPLTFRKADDLRDIARQAPDDRILLETDAPFLAPHPHRGKRNEPAYLAHTAQMLADIREESLDSIARKTTQNAQRLFGLRLAS